VSTARRTPQQQRSRERTERVITATYSLLQELPPHDLTITRIAERSGVPAPTIYRYFADRDAIIAAVLDREMEALDQATATAFLALERVTLRSMFEVGLRAHLAHHRARPALIPVWFGESRGPVVAARVRAMDRRTGEWLEAAAQATGMVRADAPDHRSDMFIRLADRTLEYVLTEDFTVEEQDAAITHFADMVASFIERWATPAGLEGITLEEFAAALGPGPDHLTIDED
jgi:AcrR family transcriptional regulator